MDIKRKMDSNNDVGFTSKRRKTVDAPSFLEEMKLEEEMEIEASMSKNSMESKNTQSNEQIKESSSSIARSPLPIIDPQKDSIGL